MKYMLLIYSDESAWEKVGKTEIEQTMAAYRAYTEALTKAGVLERGDRLGPTTAGSTARITGGKTKVLDGPYADTKEQLGGYYLIDAPDLDQALAWAKRCPGAARGAVEVRPIWEM